MAAKKRKRRLHPVAVFAITFMTVLSIGCGVLLSVYAYQNQSSAVMAEQTPLSGGNTEGAGETGKSC